jgi:ABC-2 type transport system permease protein
MIRLDVTRIRAVIRKELRDYRRNRFIVVTMAVMPAIFLALPIVDIFLFPASASNGRMDKLLGVSLLYLLLIPVLVPATVSGYAVIGERDQGTLEPLLTTPIRDEELLIGKAAAALLPTMAIAYTAFGIFLACVELFAKSSVASAVFRQGPILLAQVLFTPLLAGWAIWVGMAVSARSSDVRVAQQLGTLSSLPVLGLTSLMSFGVINPTFGLAVGLAAVLLAINVLAWRVVSAIFNRERLVTGAKPIHEQHSQTRGFGATPLLFHAIRGMRGRNG